jgi:hypothetical protein
VSSKHSKMLQESLKPIFKSEGFKKKGANWYQSTDNIFKLFSIQCSQNSDNIYFNIGIYLQTAGKREFPQQHHCHIRCRLEQLLSSKEDIVQFYELSNFESGHDECEKVELLTKIVIEKAIPWFQSLSTIDNLVKSTSIAPSMYWNYGKEEIAKAAKINT